MTKRTKEHGRGVGWTSPHASSPPSGSHARWLWLARAAWIVVAVATLAVVIFSVPSTFEYYRTVCTAALEVCSERAVGQPTPEGMRALQDVGLSANAYALLRLAVDKVFQVVWFAVGVLIFWRRSDDRMALLTSTFLVTFGTVTVDSTSADALVSSQPAWWFPVQSLQILGEVCGALFFLLFPSGRFVPPWTRWLVFADIAFQVAQDLVPDLNYASSAAGLVSLLVFIGIVVGLVWSQTYRYRRVSSEEQRRQTRWVVFGLTLGVAGTFPFQLPVDLSLIGGDTPLTLLVFKTGFA